MMGHVRVCALLFDRGATHAPRNNGSTPLFGAAQEGHLGVCTLLLDRGATHAARDDQATPLLIAAHEGHLGVVSLLLDRGATHAGVDFGGTPLFVAAQMGHFEVCDLLLNRGATHAAALDGTTPLMIAAKNGHDAVCVLLLNRGAGAAEKHGLGCVLRTAIKQKRWCVVHVLLDAGALRDPRQGDDVLAVLSDFVTADVLVRAACDPSTPLETRQKVAQECVGQKRANYVSAFAEARVAGVFSAIPAAMFGRDRSGLIALVHAYGPSKRSSIVAALVADGHFRTWDSDAANMSATFLGHEAVRIFASQYREAPVKKRRSALHSARHGAEVFRLRRSGSWGLAWMAWQHIVGFLHAPPSYWFATDAFV